MYSVYHGGVLKSIPFWCKLKIFSETEEQISSFRLIFNTVPEMVLHREVTARCHPDCVKIELASRPGIDAEDVIIARGLPGIHMPESSGKLISETFLRLYQKEG